jgi:uncharacterized DUF497 family protein
MHAAFDWDRYNLEHITRHGIMQEEAEQVLRNEPVRFEAGNDKKSGEPRYLELGHTEARRIIYVVWTPRGTKTRVVTA